MLSSLCNCLNCRCVWLPVAVLGTSGPCYYSSQGSDAETGCCCCTTSHLYSSYLVGGETQTREYKSGKAYGGPRMAVAKQHHMQQQQPGGRSAVHLIKEKAARYISAFLNTRSVTKYRLIVTKYRLVVLNID